MKTAVHPQWYPQAQVTCVCGNAFAVGSTRGEIRVEICYKCHPFFTGEAKYVDSMGRVERFQKKMTKASNTPYKKKSKTDQKADDSQPKTLREMLLDLQKK